MSFACCKSIRFSYFAFVCTACFLFLMYQTYLRPFDLTKQSYMQNLKKSQILLLPTAFKHFGGSSEKNATKLENCNTSTPLTKLKNNSGGILQQAFAESQQIARSKGLQKDYKNDTNQGKGEDVELTETKKKSCLALYEKHLQNIYRNPHLRKFYNNSISLLPEQTKGVVILTNYRSGSTLTGQLFNQHPHAFYTFEPLYPFKGNCTLPSMKTEHLHRILKCDFPSMTKVYEKIPGPFAKKRVDKQCLLSDFCFRVNTKELLQKDLCPVAPQKGIKLCGPIHRPSAMNKCRSKQMSVVKLIRVCDMQNLKPIFNDPSMDVKIIHLVRDPRGILSSRLKISKDLPRKSNILVTCNRLLHNGMCGLANNKYSKWLQGRYMRVRYEDLAAQPLHVAQKIYRFVGLQMTDDVQSWIKKHTEAPVSKVIRPYSTTRNSTATIEGWRSNITMETVDIVQSVCSKAMKLFGYKMVANQSELDNLHEILHR